MFTNILIFSCLAAQGSHSFVFSSVAHSNKKQNLAAACLFFALLAQSKTLSLNAALKECFFQQAQEFHHQDLNQLPCACELLPWLLMSSHTTWHQLFE